MTSAEIKSRSERTESKTSAKAKSGTSKTEKSVTTKVIERKPIKNTRKGEVPPSIRDSKFRFRREAETDERKTVRCKDTFVDPVPNLKKKKSPPKKAADDEIHRFSSKLIKRHEDSSESDEFLLKPCKQAIQSRAAIKRRVISSSSDDNEQVRAIAKKYDFLDDSSSSDSEFQMRMKRVSALTGGRTARKSSVPKKRNSRVSLSSSTSGSDAKAPRKGIDTSSDSSDFKMPVIKGRTKERPNIEKILQGLDLSDYSDEDMKLVTPPKRAKKARHVSSGSSSESVHEVRSRTRRTVLQLSVPISISTRSEFAVNDSNADSGVEVNQQKKVVSKAAVVETSEDSGRDVRAELLRKYGVFTSSSDDAQKDRKGAQKKSASPSMTRDEIKSKLAKFRLGSSDSEEYASSDADTISQRLLSKHEYASQLVDMNEEVSPSQKELKAKMQELGVTDSSSSGAQPPAQPAAEEPKKTKSSGVDKNFLRKYGISDSSSAEEEVIELVNPRELQERKKVATKTTDASVDSSLVRDQKHILAAYGVTDSSSDEKEDSSKLLAGSLRERLAKLEMTDEEIEDEGQTPAQKKVSYQISSSSSDTVNQKSGVGESGKVPPVKSEAPVSEQSLVSRKVTAGMRAEEDITPEEILVSSMSNVRSVIQTAHFSSDEEELIPPIPAKTTNVAKPAAVLDVQDSSTSSAHEQEKTSTTQVSRLLHNSSPSSSASIGVAHTKRVLRQDQEEDDRKQTASISLSRVKQLLIDEEEDLETPASAGLARTKRNNF